MVTDTMREFRVSAVWCGLLQKRGAVSTKSMNKSVHQVMGQDGFQKLFASRGAGQQINDLRLDLLCIQSGFFGSKHYRRVSIEHIKAGDVIAVTACKPTQRRKPCSDSEVRLALGALLALCECFICKPRCSTTI